MKNLACNWGRLVVAVLAVAVLATGCRKPKLDLSGLRDMPLGPGGAAGAASTAEFQPLDGFGTGDMGSGFGPGSGSGADAGGWQDTTQPFASGSGGAGAIQPANVRWSDVVVYFAYDSAAIGPAERPKLETLSQHLKQNANYSVVIEGHCDERGSDEYNRALAETRALVVRDHLMSLGVDGSRMDTVSYGEDKPVVPNARDESEHRLNRRAEFVIGVRQ